MHQPPRTTRETVQGHSMVMSHPAAMISPAATRSQGSTMLSMKQACFPAHQTGWMTETIPPRQQASQLPGLPRSTRGAAICKGRIAFSAPPQQRSPITIGRALPARRRSPTWVAQPQQRSPATTHMVLPEGRRSIRHAQPRYWTSSTPHMALPGGYWTRGGKCIQVAAISSLESQAPQGSTTPCIRPIICQQCLKTSLCMGPSWRPHAVRTGAKALERCRLLTPQIWSQRPPEAARGSFGGLRPSLGSMGLPQAAQHMPKPPAAPLEADDKRAHVPRAPQNWAWVPRGSLLMTGRPSVRSRCRRVPAWSGASKASR